MKWIKVKIETIVYILNDTLFELVLLILAANSFFISWVEIGIGLFEAFGDFNSALSSNASMMGFESKHTNKIIKDNTTV